MQKTDNHARDLMRFLDRSVVNFFAADTVRRRLEKRGTDTPEAIAQRVGKAEFELGFADDYDKCVINDNLDTAIALTDSIIKEFIRQ